MAQTSPSQSAASASEHEAKATLVRRYFEVIHFEKLMLSMMESMVDPMLASGTIPEDKQDVVRAVALESFEVVLPQIIAANVDIYAEAFTLEELEGLVAFYESPVGRSLMIKSVGLARNSGETFSRFQPIMEQEMRTRLCSRIDCPAGVAAPAASSAKGR